MPFHGVLLAILLAWNNAVSHSNGDGNVEFGAPLTEEDAERGRRMNSTGPASCTSGRGQVLPASGLFGDRGMIAAGGNSRVTKEKKVPILVLDKASVWSGNK